MKFYKVTAQKAQFFTNMVLGLTPAQAGPRLHNLEFVTESGELKVYRVKDRVEFKLGEVLAVKGEVTKLQLAEIEAADKKEHKAANKKERPPREKLQPAKLEQPKPPAKKPAEKAPAKAAEKPAAKKKTAPKKKAGGGR